MSVNLNTNESFLEEKKKKHKNFKADDTCPAPNEYHHLPPAGNLHLNR